MQFIQQFLLNQFLEKIASTQAAAFLNDLSTFLYFCNVELK